MTAPRLRAESLSLGYEGRLVIDGLDIEVPHGRITSVIGSNGCGKSTLLKGLGRLLRPRSGWVTLDGVQLDRIPTRSIAQQISVLPQAPIAPPGITVLELAARGRHPRQRWFEQFSRGDEEIVRRALAATDILDLADEAVDELSGGQRQRAWISMILAQQTEILLLDEPTTFLDLAHQVDVLDLVRRLNRELGRTVLMVLHDISLAASYSDWIIAMHDGSVVAEGHPRDVVTAELLWSVFGLRAEIVTRRHDGRPHVIPLGATSAN